MSRRVVDRTIKIPRNIADVCFPFGSGSNPRVGVVASLCKILRARGGSFVTCLNYNCTITKTANLSL